MVMALLFWNTSIKTYVHEVDGYFILTPNYTFSK